jgi:hypothetical protein
MGVGKRKLNISGLDFRKNSGTWSKLVRALVRSQVGWGGRNIFVLRWFNTVYTPADLSPSSKNYLLTDLQQVIQFRCASVSPSVRWI